MAKDRAPIPKELAAQVLVAADNTCCVCTVPGRPVQIHHINEDPSDNRDENLAVLCFDCHHKTQLRGGFGRHLSSEQVIEYRRQWAERVVKRRTEADRIWIEATTAQPPGDERQTPSRPEPPSQVGLDSLVYSLPDLRRLAYAAAAPGIAGNTIEMREANHRIIEVLLTGLVSLARYYPYEHFGEDPRQYFTDVIASRFRWHYLHNSTGGLGYSGTIVGPVAGSSVVADVERMIEDMVWSLTVGTITDQEQPLDAWKRAWEDARPKYDGSDA